MNDEGVITSNEARKLLNIEEVARIFDIPLYLLDPRIPMPYTMFPVHDHFHIVPMTGAGGSVAIFPMLFDAYNHDEMCPGECYRCGGIKGVDVGVGFLTCMYCGGTGECSGCNAYNQVWAHRD